MTAKTSCEIRCLECGQWFNSAIHFGDYGSFSRSTLYKNLQQCPLCGKFTPCNKDNVRFIEDLGEGHKTHFEGKDALSTYIHDNSGV